MRKYSYALGRFTSIDPLWEFRISSTPYQYGSNNPIMRSDKNGLIDSIYDAHGNFVRTENDWGWFEFLHPDRYFVEFQDGSRLEANSSHTINETNWTEIWTNWDTDVNGFKAALTRAIYAYEALKESGLFYQTTFYAYYYAYQNSPKGKSMDQKHNLVSNNNYTNQKQQVLVNDAEKRTLFVFRGVLYNWREAGNIVLGGG